MCQNSISSSFTTRVSVRLELRLLLSRSILLLTIPVSNGMLLGPSSTEHFFFNCAGKAKAVAKPAKNPAPAVSKQGHKTNPAFLHGFKQLKGLFKVKIWLSSADGNIQKLFTSVSFTQNWCKVSSVLLWGKEVSFIYLQTRAPLLTPLCCTEVQGVPCLF